MNADAKSVNGFGFLFDCVCVMIDNPFVKIINGIIEKILYVVYWTKVQKNHHPARSETLGKIPNIE